MSKPLMTISFPDYISAATAENIIKRLPKGIKDAYEVVILEAGGTIKVENTRLRLAAELIPAILKDYPRENYSSVVDTAIAMADNLIIKESQTK